MVLLAGLGGFFTTTPAHAAGQLDLSFGTNGKAVLNGLPQLAGSSFALQPDGKIVALLSIVNRQGATSLTVMRFTHEGAVDKTFGKNGRSDTALTGEFDSTAMAVQADGKIIVAGALTDRLGIPQFTVTRLSAEGALDTAFGENGYVMVKVETIQRPTDVTVQPDGKIVVVGWTSNAVLGARDLVVVRLLPSGAFDPGFNAGKPLEFYAGRFADDGFPWSVKVAASGRIYVAKFWALYAITPEGAFDATFGRDGFVAPPLASGYSLPSYYRMAVQPDGKLLLLGTLRGDIRGPTALGLVRYLPDGTLDASFGNAGVVSESLRIVEGYGVDLALQDDGKIVVSGLTFTGPQPWLLRYNTDGTLDPTFAGTGKFPAPIDGRVLLQDGKIVVAGASVLGSVTFVRYLADGPTFTRIVQRGDTPPALLDAHFTSIGSPAMNSAGHVAVTGRITGVDPFATRLYQGHDTGIWAHNSAGEFHMVLFEGAPAPGTTTRFIAFGDPVLNDLDEIAFKATLQAGSGTVPSTATTIGNDSGVWSNAGGTLHLVARKGTAAPDCPAGIVFANFRQIALAEEGDAILLADVSTLAGKLPSTGIWVTDKSGVLRLILRTGAIDPASGKKVAVINFLQPAAAVAGQTRHFSQKTGDLLYKVTYTDGGTAVYKVTFP